MIPLKYPFPYFPGLRYSAQVIIYEHDGTIAIAHGGIEMGQGIHTKVKQNKLLLRNMSNSYLVKCIKEMSPFSFMQDFVFKFKAVCLN